MNSRDGSQNKEESNYYFPTNHANSVIRVENKPNAGILISNDVVHIEVMLGHDDLMQCGADLMELKEGRRIELNQIGVRSKGHGPNLKD